MRSVFHSYKLNLFAENYFQLTILKQGARIYGLDQLLSQPSPPESRSNSSSHTPPSAMKKSHQPSRNMTEESEGGEAFEWESSLGKFKSNFRSIWSINYVNLQDLNLKPDSAGLNLVSLLINIM